MSYAFARLVIGRLLLLSALAVSALTVFAPSASASTAEVNGTTFSYTAAPGETNNVQLAFDSGTGQVTLTDSGATLSDPDNTNASGASCSHATSTTIVCTGLTSGTFDLDDMNDTLNASQIPSAGFIEAFGGAGNDNLTGSAGDDFLNGEAGTDTLSGGDGGDELDDTSDAGDTLDGGPGNDYFYFGSSVDGTDTYTGGTGSDWLDYSARTAAVTANLATNTEITSGGGESDSITGFENVWGPQSLGANHLIGDDQANYLDGGLGADVISGAGGDDILVGEGTTAGNEIHGGAGNDELYGDDGADQLSGDDGNDLLRGYDGQDSLSGGASDDDLDPGDHFDGAGFVSDGTDTVDGGDGSDTVEYTSRNHALNVDLSGGSTPTTNNGETNEHDSLVNLENIQGGYGGGSTYTGNGSPNLIVAFGGAGDNVSGLGGDDELHIDDDNVDTGSCGDGNDKIYADRVSDGYLVNDNIGSDCETINDVPASGGGGGGTGGSTTGTTTSTSPPVTTSTPVTTTTPPPVVFTVGAFVSRLQLSPKANKVFGSATIATDGSNLLVEVFNGKPSKKTLAGKLSKKALKKGVVPFTVSLNKKASKAAAKKKKGIRMTVRVTITPPSGKAFVKTFKVTVKKGKTPACFRTASVRAQAAC